MTIVGAWADGTGIGSLTSATIGGKSVSSDLVQVVSFAAREAPGRALGLLFAPESFDHACQMTTSDQHS